MEGRSPQEPNVGDEQLRCLPFIHETPGHSKRQIEGQRGGAAPPTAERIWMGGVFMKSLFDGPWVRVGTNATAKAAPGAQVGRKTSGAGPLIKLV
jgi:hypothetical protein